MFSIYQKQSNYCTKNLEITPHKRRRLLPSTNVQSCPLTLPRRSPVPLTQPSGWNLYTVDIFFRARSNPRVLISANCDFCGCWGAAGGRAGFHGEAACTYLYTRGCIFAKSNLRLYEGPKATLASVFTDRRCEETSAKNRGGGGGGGKSAYL